MFCPTALSICVFFFLTPLLTAQTGSTVLNDDNVPEDGADTIRLDATGLRLQIVYDNYAQHADVTTAHGFACRLQAADEIYQFDTGGDGAILLSNMRTLGVEPDPAATVVISHDHWDHLGGLGDYLDAAGGCAHLVLVGGSRPDDSPEVQSAGRASVKRVTQASEPVSLGRGVMTTGTMGGRIPEQGLIVRTDRGVILVTGCAHPGVVEMAERAVQLTGVDTLLLVMGGFHLMRESADVADSVAVRLMALTELVAPCHCTGDGAIDRIREHFGRRFVEVGVGSVIDPDALSAN